jgi:AcrR family transcriptional regulator
MPTLQNPARRRLIRAALRLFAAQGVTETTTKQIAELAEVNEVTLFRQFGSKHGLLLAVIEEAAVFTHIGQTLVQQANQANQTNSLEQALKDYATACLQALGAVPEMVRSVVGEAGQYPSENREALGRGFTQANHYVSEYFQSVINRGHLHSHLPADKLASLLNGMLLGYAVIEFTSEFHNLWQGRDDFLDNLVTLFLQGAVSPSSERSQTVSENIFSASPPIADLPASLVTTILQQAKKQDPQMYALMYVLFGAGLSPSEMVRLERTHLISTRDQQTLQVTQGAVRQVQINQWIMGKRYGTYLKNPLTQWLKSRKDDQPALFLNADQQPLTETDLRELWRNLTAELLTPSGEPPAIEQAQQTWCIDLLMRGMTLEQMQVLTGWTLSQLEPYAQRAREKAVVEQAVRLDQKA